MTKEQEQYFEAIDKEQYFIEHGFHVGDKLYIGHIKELDTGTMYGGDYGTVLSVESHVDGNDLWGDNVSVSVVADVKYKLCGFERHCTISFVNALDIRPTGNRADDPSFLRNVYKCLSPMECYWYRSDGEELYSLHLLDKP